MVKASIWRAAELAAHSAVGPLSRSSLASYLNKEERTKKKDEEEEKEGTKKKKKKKKGRKEEEKEENKENEESKEKDKENHCTITSHTHSTALSNTIGYSQI